MSFFLVIRIVQIGGSTPETRWAALSRDHPACVIVDVTGPPTSPRLASPRLASPGDTRARLPQLHARKIRCERAEKEKSRPGRRTASSAPTLAMDTGAEN